MTLFRNQKSNGRNNILSLVKKDTYLKVNIILAGVVLGIIIYSGIFSPDTGNYPVQCIHERITGVQCPSCGLTHSFSLILRGRIDEAAIWNSYGLRVFIFFAAQLLLRLSFSFYYITSERISNQIILFDISGSIVMFVLSFHQFLPF